MILGFNIFSIFLFFILLYTSFFQFELPAKTAWALQILSQNPTRILVIEKLWALDNYVLVNRLLCFSNFTEVHSAHIGTWLKTFMNEFYNCGFAQVVSMLKETIALVRDYVSETKEWKAKLSEKHIWKRNMKQNYHKTWRCRGHL